MALHVLEHPESYNLILEQFTGLLDSKGREIYEGDIVTHRFENGNSSGTYVIEWDNECHGWLPICKPAEGGYEWEAETDDDLEVIGNIHENPDLIESAARPN